MQVINLNNEVPKEQEIEYKRLLSEYEKLDNDIKNSIIVYKSALFLFMSKIMKIEGYTQLPPETIYSQISQEDLQELITLQKVLFEKTTIARAMSRTFPFLNRIIEEYKIDKENALKKLLEELGPHCANLENALASITLEEDLTVYRGTKGTENQGTVSNNKIISTTLFKDVAFCFAESGKAVHGNLGTIYELKLKKGMQVLVCPVGFDRGKPIESNQFEVMFLESKLYLGEKERMKTCYFEGGRPLTIDCAKGVVFGNNYDYDDIAKEIIEVNPNIDIETLKEQITKLTADNIKETKDKRRT